jgi:hypothetical protein
MPSITLPVAAIAISAVGAGVSIMGQMSQAKAASNAAKYNAAVATQNAEVQTRNAQMVMQAGQAQVAQQGMKNAAKMGGIIANQAASGLDVNTGSPLDVRSSAAELGQLDALTVRSNAVKEAYGHEVAAVNSTAQAGLDTMQSKAASQAGTIGAVGTFLGAAGSAASSWAKWQQAAPSNINSDDSFSYGANTGYDSSAGYEGYSG